MKPVLMNFESCFCTMSSSSFLLASVCFAAIIERIENDQGVENWVQQDIAGLMQQLGVGA